jgi:hypothetical protein
VRLEYWRWHAAVQMSSCRICRAWMAGSSRLVHSPYDNYEFSEASTQAEPVVRPADECGPWMTGMSRLAGPSLAT